MRKQSYWVAFTVTPTNEAAGPGYGSGFRADSLDDVVELVEAIYADPKAKAEGAVQWLKSNGYR